MIDARFHESAGGGSRRIRDLVAYPQDYWALWLLSLLSVEVGLGTLRERTDPPAAPGRSDRAPLLRADSGFWSKKVIVALGRHDVRFSITVFQNQGVRAAIAAIDEAAWVDIDYSEGGEAQVAETGYNGHRLIVRRTRLLGPQAELWPDWRHHAFLTDRDGSAVDLDADHRRHAICELAIRDLKEGAGMNHCPSGRFFANAAWLVVAALAHNLLRWVASIGLGIAGPIVAKTIRRRFLTLPGRLTRSARRRTLHLPRLWPWRDAFQAALVRLRVVPLMR